jgi:hypothetical protein
MWLVQGFALFRRSPATWLLLVFAYWIAMALLGQIRYLGLAVSTVLLPAFSVSFMNICAALDRGEASRPALLASGFRKRLATLLALGALYLASIVATLVVASLADAGALLQWVLLSREPSLEAFREGSVSRALMLAAAAGTPVLAAFWFAPVLAAWDRMGATQSLFYSFFSVLRNWRAFLVYGGAFVLLGAGFTLLALAVLVLSGGQVQAMRALGLTCTLLTLPTVFASFYAGYRDVFPGGAVPPAPDSP